MTTALVDLNGKDDAMRAARSWAQIHPNMPTEKLLEEARYHAHLAMCSDYHNPQAEALLAHTFMLMAQVKALS